MCACIYTGKTMALDRFIEHINSRIQRLSLKVDKNTIPRCVERRLAGQQATARFRVAMLEDKRSELGSAPRQHVIQRNDKTAKIIFKMADKLKEALGGSRVAVKARCDADKAVLGMPCARGLRTIDGKEVYFVNATKAEIKGSEKRCNIKHVKSDVNVPTSTSVLRDEDDGEVASVASDSDDGVRSEASSTLSMVSTSSSASEASTLTAASRNKTKKSKQAKSKKQKKTPKLTAKRKLLDQAVQLPGILLRPAPANTIKVHRSNINPRIAEILKFKSFVSKV
jgi:hypothetical protein